MNIIKYLLSCTYTYLFVPIFQVQSSQSEPGGWQCCQTGLSRRHSLTSQHTHVPEVMNMIMSIIKDHMRSIMLMM